jgi:ribosomal protein L37AE/L43A
MKFSNLEGELSDIPSTNNGEGICPYCEIKSMKKIGFEEYQCELCDYVLNLNKEDKK